MERATLAKCRTVESSASTKDTVHDENARLSWDCRVCREAHQFGDRSFCAEQRGHRLIVKQVVVEIACKRLGLRRPRRIRHKLMAGLRRSEALCWRENGQNLRLCTVDEGRSSLLPAECGL